MKYLIAGLIAIAAVWGGLTAWDTHVAHLIAKGDTAGYNRAIAEVTERELAAERRGRDNERKNTELAAKEARDARTERDAAQTALRDSERAGVRLRDSLSKAYAALARPAAPAVAGGSEAAAPSTDLLNEVQRRLTEAEDRIAEFADAAHIAGSTCQRIYEGQRANEVAGDQ